MRYIIALFIAALTAAALNAQTSRDRLKNAGLDYLIKNAAANNSKLLSIEYQKRIEIVKKEQVNKQPMPMFEAMAEIGRASCRERV